MRRPFTKCRAFSPSWFPRMDLLVGSSVNTASSRSYAGGVRSGAMGKRERQRSSFPRSPMSISEAEKD